MDARLVDGGLDQRSATAILPPSGTQTYGFWVKNTGDGNDRAVLDISGLEGIATRATTLYGLLWKVPLMYQPALEFGTKTTVNSSSMLLARRL